MFRRKTGKKNYRGKCPTCGANIQSKSSSFKCPTCQAELQLKGRQETERRITSLLWAVPVVVISLLAVAFLGLIINPRFIARYLPGYAGYLDSMDVGFKDEAEPLGDDSIVNPAQAAPRDSVVASFSNDSESSVEQKTPNEIYEQSRDSVATLVALNEENEPIGIGSGFFVEFSARPPHDSPIDGPDVGDEADPNCSFVVTNHHVIANAQQIMIRRANHAIGRVTKVLIEDSEADLALLQVELKGDEVVPPLSIAKIDPKVGEYICAIGSPHGVDSSFSDGVLSAKKETNADFHPSVFQLTCETTFGGSGGPVLNVDGKVVGVIFAVDGHGFAFAVSRNKLAELIRSPMTPRLPAQGRDLDSEVKQVIASLTRDSKVRVETNLGALLEAAEALESDPSKCVVILRSVVDEVPPEWSFFAYFLAGKARAKQLASEPEGEPFGKSDLYVAAQEFLASSLKHRPEFAPAKALSCELMVKAHRYSEALEIAKELCAEIPYCRDVWLLLSECHCEFEMNEQAMKDLAMALKINPFSKVGRRALVNFVSSRQRYQLALSRLNTELARASQGAYIWHYLIGITHESQNEYQRAIDAYQETIATDGPWRERIVTRIQELSFKVK